MGYKPEEGIGENISESDLVHPEDLAKKKDILAEAVRNPGANVTDEVRMRHRDGSWRYIEVTIRSLLDDPNVGGVVVNARDITERKLAEEALQRSERSLAAAQQIAHVGSWEYDVEKDEVRWSDEAYRIFGFSPQ